MRKFIDIITGKQNLNEGVDLYPSVETVQNHDGEERRVFSYPPNMSRQEMVDCEYCEGTGHDYHYEPHPTKGTQKVIHPDNGPCAPCAAPWGDGKGKVKKWVYDFPMMRVSHMNIDLLCSMLGKEYDDSGSISKEQIPEVKRRLIAIINGKGDYTKPATDEGGKTRVDRSGDIPRITTGARMIGGGVSSEQILHSAKRMLEILDWAQTHGCGVSWA